VIYTSGSTGKPKGVIVEHIGMMNHIQAKINDLQLTEKTIIAQNATHTFDISVWQFFAALTLGGKVVIYPHTILLEPEQFISALIENGVTILEVVPSYLSVLLDFFREAEQVVPLSLDYLVVTGEELKSHLVKKWFEKFSGIKVVNAYGPTEASDDITHYIMDKAPVLEKIPIGKPLQNFNIYIVDENMKLCPIGVIGEICVSGVGVGRGYLNNPELTSEKFDRDLWDYRDDQDKNRSYRSYKAYISKKLYKTGDLGCWLPDGTVDFFGRRDYQVKIRGFRIELGEIENLLIKHPGIKEAVVIDEKDLQGNKYLCAYIVPIGAAVENAPLETGYREADQTEYREYLLKELPDYMVPARFVELDRIPLTANSKVDRKALPGPAQPGDSIKLPTNKLEQEISGIWSEVLNIDKNMIGINTNFFELGGQSLKAIVMSTKIHRKLNIKIPLAEMFKMPTIRDLAAYIENAAESNYTSINLVEEKDFYELSYNQRRLWIAYQREPGSPAYHLGVKVPLDHPVDPGLIEKVLYRLVQRHESLRTGFRVIGDEPVQWVEKCVRVKIPLQVIDISMMAEKEKVQQLERLYQQAVTAPFDLAAPPLFRALLIKLAAGTYEFIFYMHHIITDGWSLEMLQREFSGFYQAAATGETFESGPLKLQYKEFALWQNKQVSDPGFRDNAHRYWKNKLKQGLPRLELPLDFNEGNTDKLGAVYRCVLDKELKEKLQKLAQSHNTTLFIVLFCAYNILLSHVSGQDEIVCSVISAGRDHPLLNNIVGYFVNSMCFKIAVNHEEGYTDLLRRVTGDFPDALLYQQYAIELVLGELKMKYPEFSVSFNMLNIQQETTEQEIKSFEPRHLSNMVPINFETHIELYVSEYKNGIEMNWRYRKASFKPGTIENIAKGYLKLCRYITEEEEE
jgi:amino acid adenylation domain-containing protein